MHLKIGEQSVVQVIHRRAQSTLYLSLKNYSEPLKARSSSAPMEAPTATILQKGQCGPCIRKYLVEITNYLVSTVLDTNVHLWRRLQRVHIHIN